MCEMRKKVQTDLRVVRNTRLSGSAILLETACSMDLSGIRAGQFAQLSIPNDSKLLLRRPFSIHDVDSENGMVSFLIQLVGDGTNALAVLQPGMTLNALLPLGNGFDTDRDFNNAMLIGGGVGVAPLFLLGRELSKIGRNFSFLFGARTDMQLLRIDRYRQLGQVYISTQDGSMGECGLVTENSVLRTETFDRIFCCGPTPMMKAVARFAADKGISCQVSLEHRMACGIGACLCCVEDTVDGNVCVCREGPVFDMEKLKWQI